MYLDQNRTELIKKFMYGLSHRFRFIDVIKPNQTNQFLEVFDLILNTTIIGTPRTTSVKIF